MKEITNPLRRDFVDVSREFIVNLFAEMNAVLHDSIQRGIHIGKEYHFVDNTDVPGYDIKRVGECGEGHAEPCDPEVLKKLCDETPNCAGFNMNGYLKSNMDNRVPYRNLSLTISFTHSLIHSFTHSLIHSFTISLSHSLTHSFTHSLFHSFTHYLIHSFTHSLIEGGAIYYKEVQFDNHNCLESYQS